MELYYPQKKSIYQILNLTLSCEFVNNSHKDTTCSSPSYTSFEQKNNLLIEGDNLYALQKLRDDYTKKVDLIYIDPPFSTGVKFTIGKDRVSTISMSNDDDLAYNDNLKGYEYIEFIRERLVLASELLSDVGSIYVHIDSKIGHYVKIIMDEIFGLKNFKNDITRIKCNPKNFHRTSYGNVKDMILFYSKTKDIIWNEPVIPYNEHDITKLFKHKDKNGRAYTTIPLHAPGETKNGATGGLFNGIKPPKGRHWRCDPKELEELDKAGLIEWSSTGNPRKIIYADEKIGKKMQDIWEFKDYQYPNYPTEKNLDLLKMIISTSSNENSLVMDFFCGSGTTLVAAKELNRNWIGIDKSKQAINTKKKRLSGVDCEYLFLSVESYNKLSAVN